MPYKLDAPQMRELLLQPETGVGYQCIEAAMHDQSLLKGVVLNAEVFVPFDRIEKITGRQNLSYATILNEAERPGYIRRITLIRKDSLSYGEWRMFIKSSRTSASQAEISQTVRNQIFKRFSAYENDRRVTTAHGLLPGTYATTEEDARNVSTGIEAVSRYAIPGDEPAIYVFTIKPPEKTPIRRGTVEPAFGKRGGGVEIIFEHGSPENTVSEPDTIPAR